MAVRFDIEAFIGQSVIFVPLIIGIVQAIKTLGMQDKYAPILAIAIGITLSILVDGVTNLWTHNLLGGILYGLSSVGLYSSAKTIIRENAEK